MAFFVWIDGKILQFFTKVSHKFQILTGRTNFFLAKAFVFPAVTAYLLRVVNYYIPILETEPNLGDFIMLPIMFSIWYPIARTADEADEKLLAQGNIKTVEPMKGMQLGRVILCAIFLIADPYRILHALDAERGVWFFKLFNRLDTLYIISAFYFMAVTPLPPGRSKVREFLDSLVPKPEPLPVGNKRPR